jgi:hypothetical protein
VLQNLEEEAPQRGGTKGVDELWVVEAPWGGAGASTAACSRLARDSEWAARRAARRATTRQRLALERSLQQALQEAPAPRGRGTEELEPHHSTSPVVSAGDESPLLDETGDWEATEALTAIVAAGKEQGAGGMSIDSGEPPKHLLQQPARDSLAGLDNLPLIAGPPNSLIVAGPGLQSQGSGEPGRPPPLIASSPVRAPFVEEARAASHQFERVTASSSEGGEEEGPEGEAQGWEKGAHGAVVAGGKEGRRVNVGGGPDGEAVAAATRTNGKRDTRSLASSRATEGAKSAILREFHEWSRDPSLLHGQAGLVEDHVPDALPPRAPLQRYFPSSLPGWGRMSLPLRMGNVTAVVFTEGRRLVGLVKLWRSMRTAQLRLLNHGFSQWKEAVTRMPPAANPRASSSEGCSSCALRVREAQGSAAASVAALKGACSAALDSILELKAENEALQAREARLLEALVNARASTSAAREETRSTSRCEKQLQRQVEELSKALTRLSSQLVEAIQQKSRLKQKLLHGMLREDGIHT